MKQIFTIYVILSQLILINAYADKPTYIPEKAITEKIITPVKTAKTNWQYKAKMSSNFSFTNNKDYVGQTDGSIYQFNINTEGSVNWQKAQHELFNKIHIIYGLSKTPQIEDIFKSKDQIQLISTYLYHLKTIDWIGPFTRLTFTSSLFKGYYVSSDDEILSYQDGQEAKSCSLKSNARFELVKAFEPMTIRGNLGFFANPYNCRELKVELKFGSGFQQIISNNGYVLADDSDTSEIELEQLEDHTEAGIELEADFSGFVNDYVNWSIKSNFFFPLNEQANNGEELDGIDKLNTNIEGKISSKLTEHFSMDYLLVIKRLPLILDEWQIQNGIVVNFHYDLL
jgi:hypothetical protein